MEEELVRVLLVDDDEDDYVLTHDLLAEAEGGRFDLEWVATYEAALEAMERAQHHVTLVDYRLGERDGLELLRAAIALGCKAPIIMLTGRGDRAVDVAAMQAGAADYLDKGQLGAQLLERSIRYAIERKRAEEALKEYSERLEEMVDERTRELRDAQEELVRKEKLAVLGQLAGGVAHELRNPLGAIKNAAYFLNIALEEPEPEVKEGLEIVEEEVAACERIISSLLDFARAKPPTRRKVDVNDVVQAALSRISVPENVEVVRQLDEALPTILADPDQLTQVFGNIILNGIQAMTSSSSVETPKGGRLIIKTFKTSEVSEKLPKSEGVAVSFTDTGVGIPEENLDKLFEPLFTTKAKGIGLGLALVKTLVERHGGSIEVASEVGKGSTFTVRLPLDIERVVAVIEEAREAR